MQVLLTPHSFLKNRKQADRITLEKRKNHNLSLINSLYGNSPAKDILYSLYMILETTYKWDVESLCDDVNIQKSAMYRYLNAKRRMSAGAYSKLNGMIQKVGSEKRISFLSTHNSNLQVCAA
jgi:hypothetical protein